MRQIQFYRMDGSCYLTKHLNYNGKYEVIKIYAFDKLGNVVNEFKNDEEMKRHFLDSITNEHKNNFMIVDSKAMFSEIIKYKNPTKEIYKIYMNHNPHTKFPFNYDSKIREAMKPIYDNVKSHDAIIVLTEEQKSDLVLRYGELENCYILSHSFYGKNISLDFKARDLKKVVSIARFDEQKQNIHLIKAFKKVVDKISDARLELYGFGEKENEMRELISKLNLEENVIIKGFTNNVPEVLSTAAFKIMQSKYEGQPLVILESLYNGCPVASYRTKYGPGDMIKDGKNGFLVEYNNIDELANKTIELLENPLLIEKLSNGCRESLANYTDEIFIDRWIDLFNRLMTKRYISKLYEENDFIVAENAWDNEDIGNYNIKVKANIKQEHIDRINDIDVSYRLKNRKKDNVIDIDIDNRKLIKNTYTIDKIINMDILLQHDNFCEGYWDVYLLSRHNGLVYEKRLGNIEKLILDKEDKIFNSTKGYDIHPYYKKHGSLSFKILNK